MIMLMDCNEKLLVKTCYRALGIDWLYYNDSKSIEVMI